MIINDNDECECHKLVLPRWDIYICPYCERQLAFLPPIEKPSPDISEKLKEWISRLKWIQLCKKCGMNSDTYELENKDDHQ